MIIYTLKNFRVVTGKVLKDTVSYTCVLQSVNNMHTSTTLESSMGSLPSGITRRIGERCCYEPGLNLTHKLILFDFRVPSVIHVGRGERY